jgi:hypothetical protein
VVALDNGARTLTTLHVAGLVAKVIGEQTALGAGSACQPGLYYGPPLSANPISTAAGLTGSGGATLTGEVCPASGSAAGLSTAAIEQTDDRSGGLTQTEVADIENTSPINGETVYGPFTALAQAGFAGPSNSVTSNGDPVSVSITPAGSATPVFTSANVNTAAGAAVSALAPGNYSATWTWGDSNGDSRTQTTRFSEQAPIGATGPTGPAGPRGPAGPPGKVKIVITVKCTVQNGGRKVVCSVQITQVEQSGTLFMRLERGTRIAGFAHARLRHGRAKLTVHARHAIKAGMWTLTFVHLGSGGAAQTANIKMRLR